VDDVIVPTAGSGGAAKERMEGKEDMKYYDWFFCTKKLPEDKVMGEIKKKKIYCFKRHIS
jgi:peroxiredoxin (alkyl hydroperoxide reductase subunit C)